MIHEGQRMLISQYIDAELDLALEAGLFTHITECASCREFMRHALRLRADLGKEPITGPEIAKQKTAAGERSGGRSWITGIIRHHLETRLSLSYGLSVLIAGTVMVLGILIGTMQQISSNTSEPAGRERIYVSVLPDVTVVGHMHNQERQGEKQ